jgi:hypothetical protein
LRTNREQLRRWIAVASHPVDLELRGGGAGARHRADPCKLGLIEAARRVTWGPTTRFACRFGRPCCTGTWRYRDQGHAVLPTMCAVGRPNPKNNLQRYLVWRTSVKFVRP